MLRVSLEKIFLVFLNDWKSVVCAELALMISASSPSWKKFALLSKLPSFISFILRSYKKCSICIVLKLEFVIPSIPCQDYLFVCFHERKKTPKFEFVEQTRITWKTIDLTGLKFPYFILLVLK